MTDRMKAVIEAHQSIMGFASERCNQAALRAAIAAYHAAQPDMTELVKQLRSWETNFQVWNSPGLVRLHLQEAARAIETFTGDLP